MKFRYRLKNPFPNSKTYFLDSKTFSPNHFVTGYWILLEKTKLLHKQRNKIIEERTTNWERIDKIYSKIIGKGTKKIYSKITKNNIINANPQMVKRNIQTI